MPTSGPPVPPAPTAACPRCGNATAHPFAGAGGVCLRCAGERAFALGSDAPFASLSPDAPPAPAAAFPLDAADADLPQNIGPYEIIEELGRGGMGRVFAARQRGLGRIVALKVLPVGPGAPVELEMRFLREAQTVARLRHPHIVAIHDSGRAAGHVFFSMDYLEGGDLARRLRERPFTPRDSATLVAKVAAALAFAHAEGVLHRDLKPSNILLDGDEPRLADFGLAAQLETSGDLTSASGVFGTPHYLAPEAVRGGGAALTAASDLYALGIVLYALLTGRTPFAGASPAELPALINQTDPPPLRLLAPAVPRDLETICLKCLERDPARRYSGAAALAADLRRFLAGEPIVARPLSGPGRFQRWCRRRPALAVVWLLLTTLAVGSTVAAGWIARERGRTEDALALAQRAEANARERLRAARLAEARAVRRTTVPGRRAQALAALAEAARVRPGADLRDEALAILVLPDVRADERFDLAPGVPGKISFDPTATIVAFEPSNSTGTMRQPAQLRRWGEPRPFAHIALPGVAPLGWLRFSADGALVMARYRDATLRLWHVGAAAPALTLSDRPPPDANVRREAFNDDYDFTPDATLFAVGAPGGGVSLHRSADGAELARWSAGPPCNTLRFSPDGRHLAAAVFAGNAAAPRVFVLAVPGLALEHALVPGDDPGSVAWSPDSRVLAVALRQNTLLTYDVRDGRLLQRFATTVRNPGGLQFLGGGTLLAVRGTGTSISLVNAALGHEELVFEGVGGSLLNVPSGASSFAVADFTGLATRSTVLRPVGFRSVPPPRPAGYDRAVDSGAFDFSPDGRWVVTSAQRFTLLRDVATGRLEGEIDDGEAGSADFTTAAFAAGGRSLLRCSTLHGLRRVALTWTDGRGFSAGPPAVLDAEPGFVITDTSRDRRRLALINYEKGDVKIVEVGSAGATTLSRWRTPGVYSGSFNPDGERLLVNCDGLGPTGPTQRLRVHRVADGSVAAELAGPVSCDVAWSPDGATALTSNGQTRSVLWDASSWRPRATLDGELGGSTTTFNFSPDGLYAVITREHGLHLVSTRDGTRLASIDLPSGSGIAVAVRCVPGGRECAVLWRDGRIDYFDFAALRQALSPIGLDW